MPFGITGPGGFYVPRRELDRLRSHLEGMYSAVSDGLSAVRSGHAGVYPLVNVYEDDENVYATAELSGVSGGDLDVSVHGENLIIRGERKIPSAEASVNYHRREREAGRFRRIVTLPVKIDPEKVQARVRDGVLMVTLPKAAEAKPRKISVQAEG